jgi:predicted outer membrane repeat protein
VCEDSSFSYNSSTTDVGGALYLGSSITNTIKRGKFDNNTSFLNGGAIWSDGPATIKECLFTANESTTGAGGAIYKFRAPSSGQMDVINCTFNGNLSFSGGNAIDGDSTCVVKNGNVWNTSSGINTGVTVTYSNVEGGYTGTGNKNSNPLFCGVGDDPYDLCIGSPCIDCADANAPAETTDILGRVRYDDPFTPNTGVGTPPYVDMGCYEYSGSKFEFVDLGTLI